VIDRQWDADQSVEVADGSECSDGQQAIGDGDGGVDGTARADTGDQLGYEIRLHYLRIEYTTGSCSTALATTCDRAKALRSGLE